VFQHQKPPLTPPQVNVYYRHSQPTIVAPSSKHTTGPFYYLKNSFWLAESWVESFPGSLLNNKFPTFSMKSEGFGQSCSVDVTHKTPIQPT
jgi:hypothetical protein